MKLMASQERSKSQRPWNLKDPEPASHWKCLNYRASAQYWEHLLAASHTACNSYSVVTVTQKSCLDMALDFHTSRKIGYFVLCGEIKIMTRFVGYFVLCGEIKIMTRFVWLVGSTFKAHWSAELNSINAADKDKKSRRGNLPTLVQALFGGILTQSGYSEDILPKAEGPKLQLLVSCITRNNIFFIYSINKALTDLLASQTNHSMVWFQYYHKTDVLNHI